MKQKINLILICGCGHTGSSILARIVGEHSKILLINQETGTFLANRFFNEKKYIKDFEKQYKYKLKKNNLKQFILEKTPRHIWHVDYIRRKVEGTKFILTTRYGKDTIASLYERTKDIDYSITRYQDDSIMTLRQLNLKDTHLVKYENLLTQSKKTLNLIFKFLNINYEPEILNYNKNPINWNINNPYSHGKLTQHDILRNKQVNSPLKKNIKSWSERVPKKYHNRINEFFSADNIGYKISKSFRY